MSGGSRIHIFVVFLRFCCGCLTGGTVSGKPSGVPFALVQVFGLDVVVVPVLGPSFSKFRFDR